MSTDTTPHSPLPWKVVEPIAIDWRDPLIYGNNGSSLIAVTQGGGPVRAIGAPEQRANARLIVQAVNERASLLAERDALRNALERIMEYAHDGARIRDIDPNEQPQFVAARAALAQGRDK